MGKPTGRNERERMSQNFRSSRAKADHSQKIRVIRGLFSFCSHRPAGGCDARADGSQSRGYNTTETGHLKRGSLSTKSIPKKQKPRRTLPLGFELAKLNETASALRLRNREDPRYSASGLTASFPARLRRNRRFGTH